MTDKVKFGEPTVAGYKRLSENTQDKSNKTSGDEKNNISVFNQDGQSIETPTDDLTIEHTTSLDEDIQNADKIIYSETPLSKNKTLTDIKFSNGNLNTAYKNGLKTSTIASDSSDSTNCSQNLDEFLSSLESADGKDDNDDIVDFMETDYKDGFHLNIKGYNYYEKGENSSKTAASANAVGSFKSKNSKFTLSYAGSFEYENSKQKNDQNDTQNNVRFNDKTTENALLMAKYNFDRFTIAGGATANIYNNSTELYNIYAGVSDNESGIATTLKRNIQITRDETGEKYVDNKTNIKINVLKPKPAEEPSTDVPDMPTNSKTSELDNAVNKEEKEVNRIVSKDWHKGFGVDLDMSTSDDCNEYGSVTKYTSSFEKEGTKQSVLSLTPFVGIYDYHKDSHEGVKVRTGIQGDFSIKTSNNIDIHSTAIVNNSRIMQHDSEPINTFMATLDTSVSKNNFSASVSAGYIDSNPEVSYTFLTGNLSYKIKKSSLSLSTGYQNYKMDDDKDKIFHIGVAYNMNF